MDWRSENEFSSSDDTSYDSDIIDSDIEADLYSIIHHQQDTSLTDSNEYSFQQSTEIDSSKQNKTEVNNKDIFNDIYSVNVSQNSKNNVEVQRIEYQNELNNGKSTKRKSSVVSDLLKNIELSSKKSKISTYRKSKATELNETVDHVTSDDDSDIFCLGSNETEKRLQTNLSHHTISLDNSSDSNDSWYDRLSNNSSASLSNRNSKGDLWFINEEDSYRFRRRSNRYHENDLISCNNCNEKGHIARDCTVKRVVKCFNCGKRHNPANCNRRTCAKCFNMGHDCKFCKFEISTCNLCNMIGHPAEECPDLWRRYHLTTSNQKIRNSRFQEGPIFCYNCGAPGHFGGNCNKRKMSSMTSFQTWPVVINYLPPHTTYTPRVGSKKSNKPFIDINARRDWQQFERKKRRRERKILKHAQEKAILTQQNDFPRTPKSETANQTSTNKLSPNELLERKKQKLLARKEKKEKAGIRKLHILREKIIGQNNISIPLLDLSGQNELPFSYKTLSNRAKKERKMLRKLLEEKCGSNNNISVSQKKEEKC